MLFHIRKLNNAEQIFLSIDKQSPALSHYPAPQRVTYLYYLGRYMFANNHFFRAQLALQSAYDQCHREALSHRLRILTYLIPANIILGRCPNRHLFSRPDAQPLEARFRPLCETIAKGDIVAFEKLLDLDEDNAQWFLRKQMLFQLRNRCEVLVWRSLVRRVFRLTYSDDQKVPFLRLSHVQVAARWLEGLGKGDNPAAGNSVSGREHPNWLFMQNNNQGKTQEPPTPPYIDEDFAGIDEAIAETGFNPQSGTYNDDGHHDISGDQEKLNKPTERFSSIAEIESIMASLIQQGFIQGYLTHNNPRFAIPGAKAEGPLARGFPSIWQRILARADAQVPGWVKEDDTVATAGSNVVHLSGAQRVGSGFG